MNCMGGWCMKRDHCAYYWLQAETTMERLCEPDNTDAYRRYTIRDLEASMPRKVDPQEASQEQRSRPHRVVWGRQEVVGLEGQRPESV